MQFTPVIEARRRGHAFDGAIGLDRLPFSDASGTVCTLKAHDRVRLSEIEPDLTARRAPARIEAFAV